MKDILWKYARIYSKGNDLENKKKKKGWRAYSTLHSFVDEKLFRIRLYLYKECESIVSAIFRTVILWYRKILSYSCRPCIPISSWKLSCKISIFFNVVVVVTTVDLVWNKSFLTYLNTRVHNNSLIGTIDSRRVAYVMKTGFERSTTTGPLMRSSFCIVAFLPSISLGYIYPREITKKKRNIFVRNNQYEKHFEVKRITLDEKDTQVITPNKQIYISWFSFFLSLELNRF